MPKTFEEAQEEEREKIEEIDIGKGEKIGEGGESPLTFDGQRLEQAAEEFDDWVIATPDQIKARLVQERERIQQAGRSLEFDISQRAGFGLDNLLDDLQNNSTDLQNLQDILEFTDLPSEVAVNDLGVEDLLQLLLRVQVNFISPNIASTAQLLKIISTSNAQQLAAIENILTEVRPANQFVVTGRNVINNTDNPEPVIPDADNTEIPTRTIYIRADPKNQDPVVFGDDDVDPDTGFFLNAGESQMIEQNFADQVLWMAGTSGDAVRLLGFL